MMQNSCDTGQRFAVDSMGLGLVSIFPFSRVSCRNKMFAAASLMLKLLMTTWRNHCQNCQQALAVLLAGENIPAVVYCSVPSAVLYGTALQLARLCTFIMYICADEKVGPAAGISDAIQSQDAAQKAGTIVHASCPGITLRPPAIAMSPPENVPSCAGTQPLRTVLANPATQYWSCL